MKNSFRFFKNQECEYFPCHETINSEDFNCLFCYCPLYKMEDCPGNPSFTQEGVKDCSKCLLPHNPESYEKILSKL